VQIWEVANTFIELRRTPFRGPDEEDCWRDSVEGHRLTCWRETGDVELLEAGDACVEILERRGGPEDEATTELHWRFLGGKTTEAS